MGWKRRTSLHIVLLAILGATAPSVCAQNAVGDDYATERANAINLGKQQKWLDALALYEDLARKNPNDATVLEGLAQSLISHWGTLTDPELAGQDLIRAKALLQKAQQLGDHSQLAETLLDSFQSLPANGQVQLNESGTAAAALKAGEAAFAKQDYDEAIRNYSRALELDPTSYHAALFVGDSYFEAKNLPKAAEWYDRAALMNPNIETAFRYHADMLTKQGDLGGARRLNIEAIVAEPYNTIPWRALAVWANTSRVYLQFGKIIPGCTVTPSGQTNVNVVVAPDQEPDAITVWTAYCGVRSAWHDHEFKKQFPKETEYRRSMAEEAAALTAAARVSEETLQKLPDSAIAKDASIQLLLRVYKAQSVESYVLISGVDREIARDYAAYREKNREKIQQYLSEFVVPEPPKTP
jgi:tetratricopeptide (TPR) repeat protein